MCWHPPAMGKGCSALGTSTEPRAGLSPAVPGVLCVGQSGSGSTLQEVCTAGCKRELFRSQRA